MITLLMKSRIQPAWRVQQSHTSAHGLEPLETQSKTVAIWPVLHTTREVNGFTLQLFKGFEHWAITPCQQPIRNVQPVLWINADEMRKAGLSSATQLLGACAATSALLTRSKPRPCQKFVVSAFAGPGQIPWLYVQECANIPPCHQ
jgi:hypothetical protein